MFKGAPEARAEISAARSAPSDGPAPSARIASLAGDLSSLVFDRSAFDAHARCAAAGLAPGEFDEVARIADDVSTDARARVAALELLRLRAECALADVGPIAPASRASLRAAFEGGTGDPPLAFAAVRALAVFGDEEDRRRLFAALSSPSDDGLRGLAALGLCASSSTDVAGALEEIALHAPEPRSAELALVALEGIWSDPRATDRAPEGREACAERIVALLHAEAPLTVRQRAIVLLGTVGGATARDELLAVFAGDGDRELVRSAASSLAALDDPDTGERMSEICLDPCAEEEQRVLAAEVVLRMRAPRTDETESVCRRELERAAAGSVDPALRRRAALALVPAGLVHARLDRP